MKNTKAILALLLIFTLVASLTVTANAAPADLSGHQYTAYQIFAGSQEEATTDGSLARIDWGTGISGDAFLAALKASTAFGSPNPFRTARTAADVATIMSESQLFVDNSAASDAFSKLAYQYKVGDGQPCENGVTPLPAGYYLVVDTTEFADNATNTVRNLALLQLTGKGTFAINNKASVPTVEKKVKDNNDTAGTLSDWQDSADYDIGDVVPFQVTVTLGEMRGYDTYAVKVWDTLCAGLTYQGPVTVTHNDNDVTDYFTSGIATNQDGTTSLTVECDNVKDFALAGETIVFTYSAVLNENAVIGPAGNDNTVYLEYSNNPNDASEKGKTPTDLVRVFTYLLHLNKVDQDAQPLAGAEFTLYKLVGNDYVAWNGNKSVGVANAAGTEFDWTGLDDGQYKLVETRTPDGYNTAADILFTVTAGHDVVSDNPQLNSLNGTAPVTGELSTGTLSVDVENEGGVVLPETGSEGTHMIYMLGSALLLGGLILIVTRKRVGDAA